MKYFAYGMNTNLAQMAMRCPNAKCLGAAYLPNHQFRFARHADILPIPGFVTHGVLWEITDDCLISLDALEGYPNYYQRKTVAVQHQLQSIETMTYYMTGDLPDELPGIGYVDMLKQGYFENRVPSRQIQDALDYLLKYHTTLAQKSQYIYG
jgi:gamma-glutamylcyclotransferase